MNEFPIVIPPRQNKLANLVIRKASRTNTEVISREERETILSALPEGLDDIEAVVYECFKYRAGESGMRLSRYGRVTGAVNEDHIAWVLSVLPAYDQWCRDMNRLSPGAYAVTIDYLMGNNTMVELQVRMHTSRKGIMRLYKYALNELSILLGCGDRDNDIPISTQPSNLYVIGNASKSRLKIGISSNPFKRLKDLQQKAKEKLQVYFIKDMRGENSRKLESQLHKHFKDCCLGGEWFSANLTEIIAVTRLIGPDTKDYELS